MAEFFNSSAWRAIAESTAGGVAIAKRDEVSALRHFDAARALYERQSALLDAVLAAAHLDHPGVARSSGNAQGTRRLYGLTV